LEDFVFIGIIKKADKQQGTVRVELDVDVPSSYNGLEFAFVSEDGIQIPLLFEAFEVKNNTALGKLSSALGDSDIESLSNKHLYIKEEQLTVLSGNKFYYHEVIGFEVVDASFGKVGKLTSINDSLDQPRLCIASNESEVILPLYDDLVQEVNRDQKILKVSAPEGLINFYLNEI